MSVQLSHQGVSVELPEAVFAVPENPTLVHQVVTAFREGARSGTKAQKNRAAVRGGGRKPFRQKGTGRARAGTIRSPLWRGGGKIFAAEPRIFGQKVNRKMYRGAMRAILSQLVRDSRIYVVETLDFQSHKTKEALQLLASLGVNQPALFVVEELQENTVLAMRNLPNVALIDVHEVDPLSLIHFSVVVAEKNALETIGAQLS